MMKFKRKKNSKDRGNRYHGWGRGQGHHKGAGNRGGRGNAGSGKRGDCKKPTYQKDYAGKYFGKVGFHSVAEEYTAIGLQTLDLMLEKLVFEKKIEKKGDKYIVDLSVLGFDKLLGNGRVTHKLEVKAVLATKRAIEKVAALGGNVETLVKAESSEVEAEE